MRLLFAIPIIALLLASCSSITNKKAGGLKMVERQSIEVGEVSTSGLGEPIYINARGVSADFFVSNSNCLLNDVALTDIDYRAEYNQTAWVIGTATFKGNEVELVGKKDGSKFYRVEQDGYYLIAEKGGKITHLDGFNGTLEIIDPDCFTRYNAEDTRLQDLEKASAIIYNGKDGDVLNMSYQSFYEGRLSNETDFKWDISNSNVVKYKGISFEIVKANSSDITVKLITDNTRW